MVKGAIDLNVRALKSPALQGNNGLSHKSAEVGNASYYYSLPRMETSGTIIFNGVSYAVHGTSWMDREWSTSALTANEVGWDWFSMHLSDGRDLMLYQLRLKDGSIEPFSSGSLIDGKGKVTPLSRDDMQIKVLAHWSSPHSGGQYPSRWQITLPKYHLTLTAQPYVADQELQLTVQYWEGAVKVTGTIAGNALSGEGYIEMTGYVAGVQSR